jgi:hypothetical protein
MSMFDVTGRTTHYPIRFTTALARRWIDALNGGKPIEPPPGGWDTMDLMMLAGICHMFAWHNGMPVPDKPPADPPEGSDFMADLFFVIDRHSNLARRLCDGEDLPPVLEAIVDLDESGRRRVKAPDEPFGRR